MVKKTFRCAIIEPALLAPSLTDQFPEVQQNLVLSVAEAAPNGANRPLLRSRAYQRSDPPHPNFNAFIMAHDVSLTKETYVNTTDDPDDEDRVHSVVLIERKRFEVYESLRTGALYFIAPEAFMKQTFRRYRETTGNHGATFQRRIVRLAELEKRIPEMDINGYDLALVAGTTVLDKYQVSGSNITQNPDVQEAKENAGRYKAFSFRRQDNNETLDVVIKEDGSMTLNPYPDDGPGLEILSQLEQLILPCSRPTLVNIR